MSIHAFMSAYKRVWEGQDSEGFADLFTPDGQYWNTPFQCQDSWQLRKTYWDRIKLQQDITHTNTVLGETPDGGFAHWHVEYQVASEELFEIWAKSTGTGLPDRQPGDPLPRMILDGTLIGRFDAAGRATEVRIWWHSTAQMP
ncbi:nuclear transport factor 2 family protein [Marimonas lutisalis]|uniref:nuclear transport factor 2 family protein n=1 Tax=Marimonas lutisalis TaxID=2545756 RepID=UPI0010F721AB|nr:nuclear transport factor 2 family protein [Marimonas lutisalis]